MATFNLFKNHKREAYQALAQQLNGEFIRGKAFRPDRVETFHHKWLITLDTFQVDKVTYTRIRAPFLKRDDFQFKISNEHLGHKIGKVFGMQDVEVGQEAFDRKYVIQGNDEDKLKLMFDHQAIRDLISQQPRVFLQIRHKAQLFQKPAFPPNVHELYFQYPGIIKDQEQLHQLFKLFAHVLEHLAEIGTAEEDDSEFRYYK